MNDRGARSDGGADTTLY